MDQDIRDALTDIKTSVRDGFDAVNKRIDALVTRGEFQATVERIDSQHDTLRRDYDAHEKRTEQIVEANRRADAAIAQKAEQGIEQVRADVHRELEGFRSAQWKSITLAVSIAGLVFGLITWLTPLI